MKILIIYPYCLEDRIHTDDAGGVPIGAWYVAAMLKAHGYDVDVLNWHRLRDKPRQRDAFLRQLKPDVIGFSIVQANRWGGIDNARLAKKINPRVKIVFGGIGATFLWRHLLTHFPEIDYVVSGEGEAAFLDLVRCIEQNDLSSVQGIANTAYRHGGQIRRNPAAALIEDLDQLPDPAGYFVYPHLALTRGCVGGCTFCGSPQFWGRRARSHSAGYFVRQIDRLYGKGQRFFSVSDDTFTVDKKRVIEVCREIIKRKLEISWTAISRVDQVDEAVVYWMRKAGCIQISYGVESGSEHIRSSVLNKKISPKQIRKAFSLTASHGIMARAYFIYGCPGETWKTIGETIDLIEEIKPLSAIFYILDLFPGTALYRDYLQKSGKNEDVWLERIEDILYVDTDSALSREMVMAFGKKLRQSFYAGLPGFAETVELVDRKEMYPLHADFLSRLAMTFHQGEYAGVEAIAGKLKTAEVLYDRALGYAHDARAYLGLGMIKQKQREHALCIRILARGIKHFPDNPQLNICMGISLMNTAAYQRALEFLLKFDNVPEALEFAALCYRALGETEKASDYQRKCQALSPADPTAGRQ